MSGLQRTISSVFYNSLRELSNPWFSGPILLARAIEPWLVRERKLNVPLLVTILTCSFVVGLLRWTNHVLNVMALNGWRLRSKKADWDWDKEVAVVTGGSGGIGAAVVKRLSSEGIKVAVLDPQPLPESLRDNPTTLHLPTSITDAPSLSTAATIIRSTLGTPTILINNAGIGAAHSILDTPDDWLHRLFSVNLLSHWATVKTFLPDMVARDHGHVVSVASAASFVTGAGFVDYCAAKAGVLAFHEGLAQELKHRYHAPSVLTTVVHPYWVRTPLLGEYADRLEEKMKGKMLAPEDVADAIVDQILSCRGGQLILPARLSKVCGIRGWPNWLQEGLRDRLSKSSAEAK